MTKQKKRQVCILRIYITNQRISAIIKTLHMYYVINKITVTLIHNITINKDNSFMYGVNCNRYVGMADLSTALLRVNNQECCKIKYDQVSRRIHNNNVTHNVYFNSSYYRPIWYLLNTIRHTTDIGIFPRVIGMHPIEFIKLKHKLQQNYIVQSSWTSICQKEFIPHDQTDITLEAKLITVASIMVIIQQYLKCNSSSTEEGYPVIILLSSSVNLLTNVLGWNELKGNDPSYQHDNKLITDIIWLAIKQVVSDNTVIEIKLTADDDLIKSNLFKISLTTGIIKSIMPDISLFMTADNNQYYFFKNNNIPIRNFLEIQLKPYSITVDMDIVNSLSIIIIQAIKHIPSCKILQNTEIEEYNCNNWHDMLMKKVHTLSDQQESVHLSFQTVNDRELYDNIIGVKNADEFLDSMVEKAKDKFYNVCEDNILISTNHQFIKKDMFIAFAAAHMVELLIRCGMVLTEEVFSAIFGVWPQTRHIGLLHRGIIFRDKLCNLKNKWSYTIGTQEIRVAQKTALQLLCTYFKGLDKLILIQPADVKIIPNGYSNIIVPQIVIDGISLSNDSINISDEVELIEYPIQLAVNFTNSVKHSTNMMLLLQQHIYSNAYIGIADVVLTKSDITYDIDYLATNKLAIFQYFTGFDSVENFKDWIVMLFRQDSEKGDLVSEILHSDKGILYKANRVFIILFMVIMRRDCRMLRIDLEHHIELCFKDIFEYINCNELDRLHKYAQVLSAYMEYESLIIKLEPQLDRLISKLYSGVLPDNPSTFSINEKNGNMELGMGMRLILQSHRLNMTSKLDKIPRKRILNGKLLKLIPWTSSNYKKIGSDDRIYDFTGRIPESVAYLRHGYTLGIDSNITPIQQHLNTSNNIVVDPMIQPAVTQTTAPCPKNLKRLHDSDIVPVTTAIKSRVYEMPNNICGKEDNIRVSCQNNNIDINTVYSNPFSMSNSQTQSDTERLSSQSVTLADRQDFITVQYNDVLSQDTVITPLTLTLIPQVPMGLQLDGMQGSVGSKNGINYQNNHTEDNAGYTGSFPMSDLQIQSNTESVSSQSVTLNDVQYNDVVNQDEFIALLLTSVTPQEAIRVQVDDMQDSIDKENVVNYQTNHTEDDAGYSVPFPVGDSQTQSDTESVSSQLVALADIQDNDVVNQDECDSLPPILTPQAPMILQVDDVINQDECDSLPPILTPQAPTILQVDDMQDSVGKENGINYQNNNTEDNAGYSSNSFPMSDSHTHSNTESVSNQLVALADIQDIIEEQYKCDKVNQYEFIYEHLKQYKMI